MLTSAKHIVTQLYSMTMDVIYEERGSDWSQQDLVVGTTRWLQRDQTLPLSAKGVACETKWYRWSCDPTGNNSVVWTTVKPLITDPPRSGQPLYSGRLTCPRLIFTIETNTFRTSEKRTPLNSEQRTLIRPQRTLANTKLPPKTGQWKPQPTPT